MPRVPDRTPLVSCLMVTRGRLFPARHAIDCFRAQTHPLRELVIVDDNPGSELTDYLAALGDAAIRHVRVAAGQHRLGGLRNVALRESRGELVCQWDDDDLCDPERIARQVAALRAGNADACFLRRQTLWWPGARRLAIAGARVWEGTMLARRGVVTDYPEQARGEDTVVADRILASARVAMFDAPELYCYVIHGANTFDNHHFLQIYNAGSDFSGRDGYAARLASLALRLPVAAYADGLRLRGDAAPLPDPAPERPPDRLVDPAWPRNGRAPSCAEPLVTIIVRSMGRPSLDDALHSLARQEYANLEVVIVDATGGRHPPLPARLAGDVRFRLTGAGTPLKRAAAANFGLRQARGEYIGFLDDDDLFDPAHVALLMERIRQPDHPDLVYAGLWMIDRHHRIRRRLYHPFNPLVMYYFTIITAISALVHRDVVAAGCRFDENLDVAEDWDFWLQVIPHVQIRCVDASTQYYFIEAGNSGTGIGLNQDAPRNRPYFDRVHARWWPCREVLWEDYLRCFHTPLAALHDGDLPAARRQLRALLVRYPDEPNANFALGRTYLASGQLLSARHLFERAIAMNTSGRDFMLAHAALCESLGDVDDALYSLRRAAAAQPDPPAMIREGIARLEALRARRQGPPGPAAAPKTPGRNDPCPCGSGKRYKQCCGAVGARGAQPAIAGALLPADAAQPAALVSAHAQCAALQSTGAGHYREGELLAARRAFEAADRLRPGQVATNHALALLALDLGDLPEAVRRIILAHAAAPADDMMVGDYQAILLRDRRMAEAARMTASLRAGGQLLDEQAIRLHLRGARAVMVLEAGTRSPLGGTDFSGWRGPLHFLPERTDTMPEGWPGAGGLVIVDGVPDLIPALFDDSVLAQVLIRVVRDAPPALLELVDVAASASRGRVGLIYPDATTAGLVGLPGLVMPPAAAAATPAPFRESGAAFRVGLRGADAQFGLHPLDPALIRACLALGCAVDVAGGTPLCRYFPPASRPPALRLLTHRADAAAFMAAVDCLVLRRAPAASLDDVLQFVAAGMAAGRVVLCAADMPGADLLEDGVSGFIVDPADNDAIAARIGWLRGNPQAADAIGARAAARLRECAPGGWARLLTQEIVPCAA